MLILLCGPEERPLVLVSSIHTIACAYAPGQKPFSQKPFNNTPWNRVVESSEFTSGLRLRYADFVVRTETGIIIEKILK